jgi:hypothetical protein
MYYTLFNKITDIIGELQEVQAEAEELLISREEQSVELDLQSRKIKGCLFLRNEPD